MGEMTVKEFAALGGRARWKHMTQAERTAYMREVGKKGAAARWGKKRKGTAGKKAK